MEFRGEKKLNEPIVTGFVVTYWYLISIKNMNAMKNTVLFLLIAGFFLIASCKGDEDSDRFKLLTDPTWHSDSLLVNKIDASGPAGLLEDFKGDVKFNTNGTGTFGKYTGTWMFALNETQLVITSDSLPLPLTSRIAELTQSSLNITTSFPNPLNPPSPFNIRMTFKPR